MASEKQSDKNEKHSVTKMLKDLVKNPLNILLFGIPVAAGLWFKGTSPVIQFAFSTLSIIPLAGLMSDSTEEIADFAGPGIGGLLNATFGNAPELILGLFSVFSNLDVIVKASLTGSIIGNILLVLGMSTFAGGVRHSIQKFNKTATGTSATLAVMAASTLCIPALGANLIGSHAPIQPLSLGVSIILILCYIALLLFSLVTHKKYFNPKDEESDDEEKDEERDNESNETPRGKSRANLEKSKSRQLLPILTRPRSIFPKNTKSRALYFAIAQLCVTSVLVAWMSEILVGTVEVAGEALGLSKVFMGVIIIAIVGNAAEHTTAVLAAYHNQIDIAIHIALGSALQIAMFVGPALVLCSYGRSEPMNLVFTKLELFSVFLAVILVWMVVADGESHWMEGCLLMMLYVALALGFYYLGSVVDKQESIPNSPKNGSE